MDRRSEQATRDLLADLTEETIALAECAEDNGEWERAERLWGISDRQAASLAAFNRRVAPVEELPPEDPEQREWVEREIRRVRNLRRYRLDDCRVVSWAELAEVNEPETLAEIERLGEGESTVLGMCDRIERLPDASG